MIGTGGLEPHPLLKRSAGYVLSILLLHESFYFAEADNIKHHDANFRIAQATFRDCNFP